MSISRGRRKIIGNCFDPFFPSSYRVPRVVKDQAREHRLVSMVDIPALDPEVMLLLRLATTVDSPAVANLKAEQLLTAIKVTVAMGNNLPMLDSSRRNQQTSKTNSSGNILRPPLISFSSLIGFVFTTAFVYSGLLQAGNNRSCLLIDVHIIQLHVK